MATGKKTIAILEDDSHTREVLTDFFTAKGFDVYGAESGFDIVKDVVARKPDLVITDLGLPGASGDQVMKTLKMRNFLAGVPIIIISAMDPEHVRQTAKSLGGVEFMTKPLDMERLLALANDLTARAHAA